MPDFLKIWINLDSLYLKKRLLTQIKIFIHLTVAGEIYCLPVRVPETTSALLDRSTYTTFNYYISIYHKNIEN